MKHVLYIGCPSAERADTEQLLASADLSVVWADNSAGAVAELQRKSDMPVLLDLSRGEGALQIARDLREHRPGVLLFAVVDNRRPDLTTEAVLTGVADVFARPPAARRVSSAIERETGDEQASARAHGGASGDGLYNQSPSMRDVTALISRAASMRAGVIIRGEEGTGREVVAHAIHAAQADATAFVSVDCAAPDGEDLETYLFGASARVRSAHGAIERRDLERISQHGRLHAAIGGTLYLKHIAEAPTRVQARITRLLRDREAVLLETGATIGFDLRPMAGVDPGIDSAVHEGRVRDELFRRLSVIRIDMPPLRSRREDIAALSNYFLREICRARRIPPKTVSRSALSLIAALSWRGGNAVELRMLLEAIVAGLEGSKGISIEDVLAKVTLDGGSAAFSERGGTLRQAKSKFEREYIAHVLEQHRGRISDAAKTLGIQRTNLYRKLRSLRVDRSSLIK